MDKEGLMLSGDILSGSVTGRIHDHGQDFFPGMHVRHPTEHDWGLGQVQSALGNKVTVMFEEAGKVVIDQYHVALVAVDADDG